MTVPLATLALASIALFAGCAEVGDDRQRTINPTDGTADSTVTIADMKFSPAEVRIPAGGSVAWEWDDGVVPHDVAFDEGPVSPKQNKGTWEHTFGGVGTYDYVCTLHPNMTGTVVVG